MIIHNQNFDKNEVIRIKSWETLLDLEKLEHDQIIYGQINDIIKIMSSKSKNKKYIYVASYNGDFGIYSYNNIFKIGTTDYVAEYFDKFPDNLYHLFSTNLHLTNNKCTCMPYGISEKANIESKNNNKDILCYARFSFWTFPNARVPLRHWCEKQNFIYSEFSYNPQSQSEETINNYIKNLSKSKFSICPIGNGPDTFRVWESLYSGAIPIVINYDIYKNFNELPILKIKKWTDLNENLLNYVYKTYIDYKFDLSKLKINYYNNLIRAKLNDLINESK